MDNIPHLHDFFDKEIFDNGYTVKTRFDNNTLMVCVDLAGEEEKSATVETLFDILNHRLIKITDFK